MPSVVLVRCCRSLDIKIKGQMERRVYPRDHVLPRSIHQVKADLQMVHEKITRYWFDNDLSSPHHSSTLSLVIAREDQTRSSNTLLQVIFTSCVKSTQSSFYLVDTCAPASRVPLTEAFVHFPNSKHGMKVASEIDIRDLSNHAVMFSLGNLQGARVFEY